MAKKKTITPTKKSKAAAQKKKKAAEPPHQGRPSAPGDKDTCIFPCMFVRQGRHTLAIFQCSGKALWDIVKINRKEEDKQEGYQRALSLVRAEKIAKFIDNNKPIPTSILIAFDEGQMDEARGTLKVPRKEDAGWVIDGQHRLEGAHMSESDIVFPVVAFVNLDETEQINQFVTINREQKGVPSSLYYELLKNLPFKDDSDLIKERAADLAELVKRDDTSPFYQKIVTVGSPKRGQLSLTNWVRKIAPLLKRNTGRLSTYNDESKVGIINNYYRGLAHVFGDEFRKADSIFFRTLGFGALINALPTFLDLTLQHKKGAFRVSDVVAMFKTIEDFDFETWRQAGTGSQAEVYAGGELIQAMQIALANNDEGEIRLV